MGFAHCAGESGVVVAAASEAAVACPREGNVVAIAIVALATATAIAIAALRVAPGAAQF